MNEVRIQNAIWHDRGRQNLLMCPNYTPSGWRECDVWMVTKAGYAVEFEIKVSIADYRADAKKTVEWRESTGPNWWDKADRSAPKHELLAKRDRRGPSRFYFVVPDSLGLTPDQVPTWAGLIEAHYPYRDMTDMPEAQRAIRLRQVKDAPILHREKVPQGTIDHCRSVFFWRYWNLRSRSRSEKILTDGLESAESPQLTGDSPDDYQAHVT